METDETLLTLSINPNLFPAKLWALVNDPQKLSINWDPHGEAVIINQQLFEAELLRTSPKMFKTNSFSSFVRQLNLYGFKKLIRGLASSDQEYFREPVSGSIHYHNPNFKRDHPELLSNLKRMTRSTKGKTEAPNSPKENSPAVKKGSVLAEQTQRGRMNSTPYPYRSSGSQQMKNYDRTPLQYRAYCTDKGVPLSICHFPADSPYTDTFIHHHHPWCPPGFHTPGADGGSQQGSSKSGAVREVLMESLVKEHCYY